MQNKKPFFDQQQPPRDGKINRWKQGNTSQGLNDRGADYQSMNWDRSGRDYHSNNFGQRPDRMGNNDSWNAGSGNTPGNYQSSDWTPNWREQNLSSQNSRQTHDDAEYAFRNRQDSGNRGGNSGENQNDGYGRDYFESTRYGSGDQNYGREAYGQYTQDRGSQDRYSTESDRLGSHFGKGPKGYKRSDARIQEDVHEALTHDHDIDATEIEVSVKDGIVTLSGSVTERKMKRLAEDCVEQVFGVSDVRNEITTSSSFFSGSGTKSEAKGSTSGRGKNSNNTDMM